MVPTYYDGDWLLVHYGGAARSRVRAGDVVVARDPRQHELVIVKRATRQMMDSENRITWWLLADNEFALGDSRQFGAVSSQLILGRVVNRFRPIKFRSIRVLARRNPKSSSHSGN